MIMKTFALIKDLVKARRHLKGFQKPHESSVCVVSWADDSEKIAENHALG